VGRVVRILRLLRDQCRIELLVAADISRIDVLRRLAIGVLSRVSFSDTCSPLHCLLEAGPGLTAIEGVRGHQMRLGIQALS
jgi:hypothetical protein